MLLQDNMVISSFRIPRKSSSIVPVCRCPLQLAKLHGNTLRCASTASEHRAACAVVQFAVICARWNFFATVNINSATFDDLATAHRTYVRICMYNAYTCVNIVHPYIFDLSFIIFI